MSVDLNVFAPTCVPASHAFQSKVVHQRSKQKNVRLCIVSPQDLRDADTGV